MKFYGAVNLEIEADSFEEARQIEYQAAVNVPITGGVLRTWPDEDLEEVEDGA